MKQKNEPKLIIIDCYGFLFRAYYACPKLTNSNNIQVGALYGFASMLLKIMIDFEFDIIAATYDSGGKNFRHDIYNQYKATRKPIDEELKTQLEFASQVTEHLGITTLKVNGFEADDIIASLVKRYAQTHQIIIISSDKDLMQLIDCNTTMYDGLKKKYIDHNAVYEKFQTTPEKLLDYLSIVGDASDNIPGIKGIGPKGAINLLTEFENLENIIASVDEIKAPNLKKKIQSGYKDGLLSRQLIALNENVDVSSYDLQFKFNYKISVGYLEKMDFTSLLTRLKKVKEHLTPNDNDEEIEFEKFIDKEINLDKSKNLKDLDQIKAHIQERGKLFIYFDSELTSALKSNLPKETLVLDKEAIELDELNAVYICSDIKIFKLELNTLICHSILNLLQDISLEIVTTDIKKFFNKIKVCSEVTLQQLFCLSQVRVECLDIMHYVCYGTKIDLDTLSDSLKIPESSSKILISIDLTYKQLKKTLAQSNLLSIYREIDLPLAKILAKIEFFGIEVDVQLLQIISKDLNQKLHILEKKIYELAGEEFNIGSPKQMGHVLFEKLRLKAPKNHATDISVLEDLHHDGVPIAGLLIKWREFSKLRSTYAEGLQKYVVENKIHTTLDQTMTLTGRLSSYNPNLQNLPTKAESEQIKECFIARDNYQFISMDYSQIELRVLSLIANVGKLLDMFDKNMDVHTQTAMELFDLSFSEVTIEHRRKAKTINFGIIYGMGQFGLAKRLHISHMDAKAYIERFFSIFPEVKTYMYNTVEFAKQHGYVKNLYGRRLFIDKTLGQQFFDRSSINAPIQGTASDIVKIAMLKLDHILHKLDIRMILQVHDEIIFECKIDQVEPAIQLIKSHIPKFLFSTQSKEHNILLNNIDLYQSNCSSFKSTQTNSICITLPINIYVSDNLNFTK